MPLFSPDDLLDLVIEKLGPSPSLQSLVEDMLPDSVRKMEGSFSTMEGNLDDFPADDDLPDEAADFSKNYSKNLTQTKKTWAEIKTGEAAIFHEVGSLFDHEFKNALKHVKHLGLEVERASLVISDWAELGNTLMAVGFDRFSVNTNEGRSWRFSRGRPFWDGLIEYTTPEQAGFLPAGPLLDWGLLHAVLRDKLNQHKPSGLPVFQAWLEHVEKVGKHLDDPDNQWRCLAPRFLSHASRDDFRASNTHDPRPLSFIRDDHRRQTVKAKSLMETWLASYPAPPAHPAACDWSFRIETIRSRQDKTGSLALLEAGFSRPQLAAWVLGQDMLQGGQTATDVIRKLEESGLPQVAQEWVASRRADRAPSPDVYKEASRSRCRP